jgi:hypothetical protein
MGHGPDRLTEFVSDSDQQLLSERLSDRMFCFGEV